jgi:predicted AAA+ superfamily ATPase
VKIEIRRRREGQEAVEEKMSVSDIVGLNLISFLITFPLFLNENSIEIR